MVLLTGLIVFVLVLLTLNKIVYGGWFLFPWSYNNPFNVVLREIEAVRVALNELGEELDAGIITQEQYIERIDIIHEEMDRLSRVELP